ncbi:hypothetical protein HOF56_03310 [Candidatus Peribacteria bacterium]|jgi:hypothetical protein|nr:hypothetical protein [Candidatus Peribacteria bacterium]MBT4240685.1 hypothetical protein [Candidatus Peribacteria bacterium]
MSIAEIPTCLDIKEEDLGSMKAEEALVFVSEINVNDLPERISTRNGIRSMVDNGVLDDKASVRFSAGEFHDKIPRTHLMQLKQTLTDGAPITRLEEFIGAMEQDGNYPLTIRLIEDNDEWRNLAEGMFTKQESDTSNISNQNESRMIISTTETTPLIKRDNGVTMRLGAIAGVVLASVVGILASSGRISLEMDEEGNYEVKVGKNIVRVEEGEALEAIESEIQAIKSNPEKNTQKSLLAIANIVATHFSSKESTMSGLEDQSISIEYRKYIVPAREAAYKKAKELLGDGNGNMKEILIAALQRANNAKDIESMSAVAKAISAANPEYWLGVGDTCGKFLGSTDNGPSDITRKQIRLAQYQMMLEATEEANLGKSLDTDVGTIYYSAASTILRVETGKNAHPKHITIRAAEIALQQAERLSKNTDEESQQIAIRAMHDAWGKLKNYEIDGVPNTFEASNDDLTDMIDRLQEVLEIAQKELDKEDGNQYAVLSD